MPSPLTALTTLDRQLGTFWEASLDDFREMYIGSQVLPIMNVGQPSWTFKRIPLEELLRLDPDLRRMPGSAYKRSITQFTQDSYTTQEYGYEELIDDKERAMYGDFFDAVDVAVRRLTHSILQAQEARVAALVFDTGVYTGALAQAVTNGQWSTLASSIPIQDCKLARDKMFANSGYYPNTAIMNRKVFETLQLNAEIKSAIASSGAGDATKPSDITRSLIAQCLGVDQVLVAGGGKNTAALNATPAISHIWGNHVMLCKVASSNDIQEPCIGRQFHWAEDGSQAGGRVDMYREEQIRSEVVRVRQDIEEKLLYPEMGILIPSAIA